MSGDDWEGSGGGGVRRGEEDYLRKISWRVRIGACTGGGGVEERRGLLKYLLVGV